MITIRIKGGLGNQMFQYAAAYTLANRLGQKLLLDTSFYPRQTLRGFKLDHLNVINRDVSDDVPPLVRVYKNKYINKALRRLNCRVLKYGKKAIYLLETRSDIVPEFFDLETSHIYLDGYYQSENYFKQYRTELLMQFSPNYRPSDDYMDILQNITHVNSVAVHVRRGDFLSAQHDSNPNHYLLNERYYVNSLRYVDAKIEHPTYFWFSDDIEWVKKNFGEKENYRFVNLHTKYADIDEMMLMKNCKHIIAANSTFSWWATWLNTCEEGLKIVPMKRFGNLHIIPDNWVKIPVR